ncbi:MAG: 5'/3'-nucleotidase SurE [Clostridiales bacterium]|nr:5'/3'-nucleotidase SurE [Clostridiales bacterium]
MHIFLVNDDGIGAKGIMALWKAAVERGHEVSMCAPRTQQSAASHRFTLTEPIYVEPWPVDAPGCEAFSIAGSPVDCVRVGLQQLVKKPVDLVLSGINNGYNAGMAVHYSGTVGAAMEGALNHLPAIASSIHHKAEPEMLEHLARYTILVAEQYVKAQTPPCTILNINAPCVPPEELKAPVYAPLDMGNFIDGYERRESPRAGTYFWLLSGSCTEEPTPGSDVCCLREGHITLTLMGNPVTLDKDVWSGLHIG